MLPMWLNYAAYDGVCVVCIMHQICVQFAVRSLRGNDLTSDANIHVAAKETINTTHGWDPQKWNIYI